VKRSLCILGLLLVLAVGLLVIAHVTLNMDQDKVVLTETVLAGDRAAAAGVTVTNRVRNNTRNLRWETVFTPAAESLNTDTAFDFALKQESSPHYWESNVSISVASSSFGIGSSHNIDLENPDYGDLNRMVKPVADVASRTKPGEEHTEVVLLEDYYEYYPVDLDCSIYDEGDDWERFYYSSNTGEGDGEFLTEYFAIGILPGHQVEVTTYRDEAGNLVDINCMSYENQPRIDWVTVLSEDGIFIYVSAADWDTGEPLDLIQCADGKGIYFIPFGVDPHRVAGEGYDTVDVERISLVYPMEDVSGENMYMTLSDDGTQLLIYSLQAGELTLTVLDTVRWEIVQKLPLLRSEAEQPYLHEVLERDGFQVVIIDRNRFALVTEEAEGFVLSLTGQLGEEWSGPLRSHPHLAWDGQRLVWAGYDTRIWTESLDYNLFALQIYLAVLDETGVAFAARYDHSIFNDPIARREYCYYPDGGDTLKLQLA